MKKNREPIFLHGEKMKKMYKVMKLSAVLLMCCFIQISATVYSQSGTISVKENSISLSDLLWEIQRKTDFVFAFSADKVEPYSELTVNVEGSVEEVLDAILKDTKLDYEVKNGVYVITYKKVEVLEQQPEEKKILIKGTVVDEKGEPLPFAAVCFKGTTYGCVSAVDGTYELEAPDEEGLVLEVSSLGFATQIIPVDGRTIINIVLVSDIEDLDEVVVTGYSKTSKVRSSVAAGKIKSEEIERQVTANLDQRMEGLATGLNINTVSTEGGHSKLELIIRSTSTFEQKPDLEDPKVAAIDSRNRQPLIVVDGFPYEGSFNDIDQETIKAIDVLKDAAATAVWGMRASNGVIVITTKRGKQGKPNVSFSTNWTFGTEYNLNDFGLASSADLINVRNGQHEYMQRNARAYQAINHYNIPSRLYMNLDPYDHIWASYYDSNMEQSDMDVRDAALKELGEVDVLDQFQEEFLRPAFTAQNSLSINGGSEHINYNFTATHTKDNKTIVGDDMERLALALTTDIKLNDKLSTLLDVNFINTKDKYDGIGLSSLFTGDKQGTYIPRYSTLRDESGNSRYIHDVYQPRMEEFANMGFYRAGYDPISELQYNDNGTTTTNLRLAAGLNYKITSYLTANVKYQFNRVESKTQHIRDERSYYLRNRNNNYVLTPGGEGKEPVFAVPQGNWNELNKSVNDHKVIRGSLDFYKVFADNHSINAMIGMEATENDYTANQQRLVGYNSSTGLYDRTFDHAQWMDNDGSIVVDGVRPYLLGYYHYSNTNLFTDNIKTREISSFSRINYSYADKYILTASLKLDQATAFGINKRLATTPFYGMSGAWNLHKENFINANWLDQLKLRVSYGLNGNLRRGLFSETVLVYHDYDSVNGRFAAGVADSGNPNLSPEMTTTWNYGVDLSVFKRLNATIDIYNKQSEDLLVYQEVSTTYGLPPVYSNDGEISNKGFEVNLNGDILRKGDLNWNSNLNFSYNKNKVVKYGDRMPSTAEDLYYDHLGGNRRQVGEDISSLPRYDYAGLDKNGDPQIYLNDGTIVGVNDPLMDDLSEDHMVTSKPTIAPMFGGWTNEFSYKQFSISALITYKFGHVFEENKEVKYPRYGFYGAQYASKHKDIANAWSKEGDEAITGIPAAPRSSAEFYNDTRYTMFAFSNYGIHDASHIRFKDITFRYQLTKNLTEKVGIKRATFTFQVRDLGLLWKANDVDIDPESVPFKGRDISFGDNFTSTHRPVMQRPVSFVVGARFEF